MEYRRLGNSGLKASILSLGTMTFGYPTDKKTSIDMIEKAIGSGINLIDTAVVYPMKPPFGVSEEIVGEAVKNKRQDVLIATKVHPGRNSRLNILKNVEDSLRRLQTDYIDLYQIHTYDIETPIEETLEVLSNLVRQGKVRYIGCSNLSAWQLAKSLWMSDKHNLSSFISNQVPYNLLNRKVEEEITPLCLEEGVGILAYSPRAFGILAGKYKWGEKPPKGTRGEENTDMNGYYTEENMKTVDEFCRIAGEMDCTPAQLAASWLAKQPGVCSVILGARTMEQMEDGIRATEVELTEEGVRRISLLTDYTLQKGVGWSDYRDRQRKVKERFDG